MQRNDVFIGGRFYSRQFFCSGANQRRLIRWRKFDVRWSGRD